LGNTVSYLFSIEKPQLSPLQTIADIEAAKSSGIKRVKAKYLGSIDYEKMPNLYLNKIKHMQKSAQPV